MKNRKGLTLAISILVSIFFMSIVYAASAGALEFDGTAMFAGEVELVFTDASFPSVGSPGAIKNELTEEVIIQSAWDDKLLDIAVELLYPGDYRIIKFKIANIQALSATITSMQTDEPDPITSGIIVTWPDLENVTIIGGQTSEEYEIIIEWESESYGAIPDVYYISAILEYEQADL